MGSSGILMKIFAFLIFFTSLLSILASTTNDPPTCTEDCECDSGNCEMTSCVKDCECDGGNCKMPACVEDCECEGGNCPMTECVEDCECEGGNCDAPKCTKSCDTQLDLCIEHCNCDGGNCDMPVCVKDCHCSGGGCAMPVCTAWCKCYGMGGCTGANVKTYTVSSGMVTSPRFSHALISVIGGTIAWYFIG